jgi:hypothetical protein
MKNFTVVSEGMIKTNVIAFSKEDAKQNVMKQISLHWSQILWIERTK